MKALITHNKKLTKNPRERILNAAEELFAQRGFEATSMRALTNAAKVNLASVNYYFGSKNKLITQVLDRGLRELNTERLKRLDALEKPPSPPTLEKILEALFLPAFQLFEDPHKAFFLRILCRAHYESKNSARALIEKEWEPISQRFCSAMKHSLPDAPDKELYWRLHFAVGSMIHALSERQTLNTPSGSLRQPEDYQRIIERLIAFSAAGIRLIANHGDAK